VTRSRGDSSERADAEVRRRPSWLHVAGPLRRREAVGNGVSGSGGSYVGLVAVRPPKRWLAEAK